MRLRECYLAIGLVIYLSLFKNGVRGENVITVSDDDGSDELLESSSVPAFVRSRFNLRIWSTTVNPGTTGSGVHTDILPSTKAPKINRFRTQTTQIETTATTEPIIEVVTNALRTTAKLPVISSTKKIEEIATLKSVTAKKLSQACGELNGDDVPWIAILEHTNPNGEDKKKTLSKGVLIDDQHVLTTISSIHNSYPFWVVTGVRLGDSPTWAAAKGAKEVNSRKRNVLSVAVKNVFLHEKKDIAVIRLAERVNFTEKVRPICLPSNDRFNYTDMYFHVCKKDKSDFGRLSISSKLIAVTYLSQKDCQILFRRHKAEVGPKEFCVWDETGDNCTGDLGGPLMVKIDGRHHVIGLNSYALAKSKIDSEGLPGVYVRVGSFYKWIQAVLRTEFDETAERA